MRFAYKTGLYETWATLRDWLEAEIPRFVARDAGALIHAGYDPAGLESFLARWAADAATGRSRASDRQ